MYLRRNDLVVVISGVEKGKQGRVLRVDRESDRVIVQGINLRFKHVRRTQKNPRGGRVQKEAAIPACKVMLVDPKTNRPTRIGFRVEKGRKVRYSKKSQEII
jgi:large subunit ribosomal protein L24